MGRSQSFTAIDINRSGRAVVDQFQAKSPTAAARRAQFAAEGDILQLWCEGRLVGSWRRVASRTFEAA